MSKNSTPQPLALLDSPVDATAIAAMQACCPDLFGEAISEEEAVVAARVFKALADPARVRLLSMIAQADQQEACVCDLIEPVGLAQPTVSHHLKVLLDAGLVERERRGSWAYYRLKPDALLAIRRALGA